MDENSNTTMGRYRALLTETDREHITGEGNPTQDQKDQSVYRVRQRIREELPQDIEVLEKHRPDVLDELREVICPEGRKIYCPVCGEEFDVPSSAVRHLSGATQHDLSIEEIRNRIPEWWREEQENLPQYLGEENTGE